MKMEARERQTLTEQELQAAYLARYDLGPGYPQLAVPEYIRRLYLDTTAEDLSLKFPPAWSSEKQSQVDGDLRISVKRFLDLPDDAGLSVRETFSGSIALDRALAAMQNLARKERRKKKTIVITTTPCIDIMRLFLLERDSISAVFVQSEKGGVFGALDESLVLEALENARSRNPDSHIALLLSSPENPTGNVWTESELREIARHCAIHDATLIVDHCFLVAGVHPPEAVPRVWDTAHRVCRWLAVWDTGKTFGLNEDKLGFIISADPFMREAVDSSLGVLQFGVARRAKIFFTDLLRIAKYYDHTDDLRKLCLANMTTLAALSSDHFMVRSPATGSLALVDISKTGQTDEEIRTKLLSSGIGVIAGQVFFHTKWSSSSYIRLALARHEDYFREAALRIKEILS